MVNVGPCNNCVGNVIIILTEKALTSNTVYINDDYI